jgi:predicted transcriptional regulator
MEAMVSSNVIAIHEVAPLETLAARIQQEHEATVAAIRSGVEHAIAAGKLLLEAKAQLKRGRWLPWLKDHCKVPARTAQLYMWLAEHDPNAQRVADLPLRRAVLKLQQLDRDAKRQAEREQVAKSGAASASGIRARAWDLFGEGRSQQQIATELGVSQSTVSTYLRGEQFAGADNAGDPEASAEAMKAAHADDDYAPEEEFAKPVSDKTTFLLRADLAERYAAYSGRRDSDVREAIARVISAWRKLERELRGRPVVALAKPCHSSK